MKQTSKWFYVRILYVATGIFQGLRMSPSAFPFPWVVSLVVIILVPIMLTVVIKMNANNGIVDDTWYPPDWYRNPFTLRQPFQFFHMVAWQAIVAGIVACFRFPWIGSSILGQAAVGITFGIGILIGIQISQNIFRDCMAQCD